jgi:hypothetical protein
MEMDITDQLTPEGIEKLQVGDMLRFNQGGDLYELKIIGKEDGRIKATPIITHDIKDIAVTDADKSN